MSSTTVTLAGIAAHVLVSNDVAQSRLSTRFLQTHISQQSRSSFVELLVTASLNCTAFTCVLDFVVDPSLYLCDAVLGLDWSQQCYNADMQSLVLSFERLQGLGEYCLCFLLPSLTSFQ